MTPPFVAALGPAFDALPGPIRALHGASVRRFWRGRVTVTGARGPVAWAMALAGISPRPMTDAPFSIEIAPDRGGEIWRRDFDGVRAVSHVRAKDGRLLERTGSITYGLHPEAGAAGLRLTSGRFSLAGLPLPRRLVPSGRVALGADGERYLFDVAAISPAGRVALRYEGWLLPA